MLARWLPFVAFLAASAIVACAPPTLPAGADQGAASSAGTGDDDTTKKAAATGDDDDTSTTTAPTTNAAATTTTTSTAPPATFDTVYADLQPTCGTCHASGGTGPTFFGADEPTTYTNFKTQGFNKSGSALQTHGAHEGPALTSAQATDITAWVTAEGG